MRSALCLPGLRAEVSRVNLMKRVAILSPSHQELNNSYRKSTASLNPAANNLGNLLFRHAVMLHTSTYDFIDEGMNPEMVKERYDVIVMPLANLLHPWATSWESWANKTKIFLEACNLPLIPLGMGAQAMAGEKNPEIGLPGFIKELAVVIGSLSKSIGVRGKFTAEVLDNIGVKNTVVIGCPSNFISPNQDLGKKVYERHTNSEPIRLCLSGNDFYVDRKGVEQAAQRKLLDYMELHDAFYLIQAPESLFSLTRHDHKNAFSDDELEDLRNYLRPSYSKSRFHALLRKNFISLPTIESWFEFISGCDLFIGMRIHGAMASMQTGTMPICITHDRRTEELCETMLIPSIKVQDFSISSDIYDVYKGINFDAKEYDEQRLELASRYKSIYDQNDITCHLPFSIN